MGHKPFYRFVFSLFVSLNTLVYLAKTGYSPLHYSSAALLTFGLSYIFAMLVFKRLGWRKSDIRE